MRIAGWICLLIGGLSFLGAFLKGNSVFGPMFWLALGIFLLYKFENKDEKEGKKANTQKSKIVSDITKCELKTNNGIEPLCAVDLTQNKQRDNMEDTQSQLTLQQREAALCLISFFGGYNKNLMDNAPLSIFKQAALFFGIPSSPIIISEILMRYSEFDTLIDIVLTIKPIRVREFLILSCYDMIKSTNDSEATNLLFKIANDMGYDRLKVLNLIDFYS